MTTYEIRVDGECVATFEADLAQASAPITLAGRTTPFQTADARHDSWRAAELLNRWCASEGGEIYSEDDDIDIDVVEAE